MRNVAAGLVYFVSVYWVTGQSIMAWPFLIRLAGIGALLWLFLAIWEWALGVQPRRLTKDPLMMISAVAGALVYYALDPREAWIATECAATTMLGLAAGARLFRPHGSTR